MKIKSIPINAYTSLFSGVKRDAIYKTITRRTKEQLRTISNHSFKAIFTRYDVKMIRQISRSISIPNFISLIFGC